MFDNLHIDEFEEMLFAEQEDRYLKDLLNYYHFRLLCNLTALQRLNELGLSMRLVNTKHLGYCDRTLNSLISNTKTRDAIAFRGCLQRLELIRPSGHELFRGCLVEPCYNKENKLIAICGQRLNRITRPAPETIHWFKNRIFTLSLEFELTKRSLEHA